jgi:hypothetical protein
MVCSEMLSARAAFNPDNFLQFFLTNHSLREDEDSYYDTLDSSYRAPRRRIEGRLRCDRGAFPGRSSVRAKRMVVAHLIRLAAGIVVIVTVSMLMRVGDLLMRVFVGAPLRRTVGVET